MRTLTPDRAKLTPLGRLTRSEWTKLPSTSPAKAGRTHHATKIITLTYLVVAVASAVTAYSIGSGLAGAAFAAVASYPLGGSAALRVDRHLRWRFYRSLWDEGA